MQATKQEMIDRLRQDLMAWEGFRPLPPGERQEFGLGAIENAFPNQTFPTGALHEFISTRPEFTAAIGSFIAGIIQTLLAGGGVCVWVSYTRRIYPPSLKRFGVNPDRIMVINKQLEDIKKGETLLFNNVSPRVAQNLQNLNFFENDLGLAAAINDDTWASK